VEAVTRSDEGEDSSAVGLLGWLVGYKHYLERTSGEMSAFRFPGGAQSLVARMSETLQGDIFFDHILHSVEQNEESVQIWCKGEMAFGDRVVITLPPPVLRKIEFPFDFPDEKLKAWETIGSARAIKVTLRFKRRFWLDEKWQGRMLSNLPFQQIWDSGREGAACLSAYICGQAAVNIARQRDPVAGVLRAVSEVAPLAQEEFVEGWLHDWIHDPYSLGAFTSLTPGSVRDALPHLATPVGRIHFAGEYASSWQGFVEGALESAERVVEEVLESGR
jgi:monoamine oxidase